jgi:4-hydroxy-tetrahydrodipicolinate synthase
MAHFSTIGTTLRTSSRCVRRTSAFSTNAGGGGAVAAATADSSSSLLLVTQKRHNIHSSPRYNPLVLSQGNNAGGRRLLSNNKRQGTPVLLRKKQQPQRLDGVYPIVVTPFYCDDDHDNIVGNKQQHESIDYDSFQKCIRFYMDSQVCSGVTICGVLGESNRLSDKERCKLIETAITTIREHSTTCNGTAMSNKDGSTAIDNDNDDQFQLIVGTTHTGTAPTIQLCQMAQELGAHGVMVAPTKDGGVGIGGPQPSNHAMRTLFERIAVTCGPELSMVVQDHPTSTSVYTDLDFLVDLVCDIESIRCIKLESLPTMDKLAKLRAVDSKFQTESVQERCTVLTGLGALYAGFDLEQQMSSGFMTGFAFPEILHAMYLQARSCRRGDDMEQVHRIYQRYLPLIVFEQQPGNTGLMIRKEILKMRGMITSSHLRHPGGSSSRLSDSLQRALRAQIARSFPPERYDITKPIPIQAFLS